MQVTKINRVDTGLFSKLSNELTYNQGQFADFIQQPFSKKAFLQQIDRKKKQYEPATRLALVQALQQQYAEVSPSDEVSKNLDLLQKDSTFTITTGHQLSLFSGPLYFIYKIVHVIKLCRELKATYPQNDFVPVFWLASEDHDFEEVNHFHLFGKTKTWETNQKGAVGRFDTESLATIREELHAFFANHADSEIHQLIDTYSGQTFGKAQFQFVHELFKNYGLIIVEPDVPNLKKLFVPIIKKELLEQFAEQKVNTATKKLNTLGFKGQVFPRPINFFYVDKNLRERFQFVDGNYYVENVGSFSEMEILNLLQSNPEKFSPNVVFRPVYQEVILPNLCYVGGGGEMAYWLQLKGVFDEANVVFPLMQVRNSLHLIDANSAKKMEKLNLNFTDFLKDTDQLKKEYVQENSEDEVDFRSIQSKFEELKTILVNQLNPIDAQLEKFTEIENTKLDKQFEGIQTKVVRIQKQKMETSMKQIDDLKNKFFPNGSLQERVDSFLTFCPTGNYSDFIKLIFDVVEPFENDFLVVEV